MKGFVYLVIVLLGLGACVEVRAQIDWNAEPDVLKQRLKELATKRRRKQVKKVLATGKVYAVAKVRIDGSSLEANTKGALADVALNPRYAGQTVYQWDTVRQVVLNLKVDQVIAGTLEEERLSDIAYAALNFRCLYTFEEKKWVGGRNVGGMRVISYTLEEAEMGSGWERDSHQLGSHWVVFLGRNAAGEWEVMQMQPNVEGATADVLWLLGGGKPPVPGE